jgi:hypothetical protein
MTMRLTTRILSILTALLLAACAHRPSGEPTESLGDKTKGVIAASTTYTDGTRTLDSWFYIRKKGESNKDNFIRLSAKPPASTGSGLLALTLSTIGTHSIGDFPDTPDHSGRVLAVQLEPGEYELYSWTIYVQAVNGYGYISPKAPPTPLPFQVQAGVITYLGNLHGQTVMGQNVFGMDVPGGGIPSITDRLERDKPMLKAKFPMLQDWPITSANLNGKEWAQQ